MMTSCVARLYLFLMNMSYGTNVTFGKAIVIKIGDEGLAQVWGEKLVSF